jgi:hypothetical protein
MHDLSAVTRSTPPGLTRHSEAVQGECKRVDNTLVLRLHRNLSMPQCLPS